MVNEGGAADKYQIEDHESYSDPNFNSRKKLQEQTRWMDNEAQQVDSQSKMARNVNKHRRSSTFKSRNKTERLRQSDKLNSSEMGNSDADIIPGNATHAGAAAVIGRDEFDSPQSNPDSDPELPTIRSNHINKPYKN